MRIIHESDGSGKLLLVKNNQGTVDVLEPGESIVLNVLTDRPTTVEFQLGLPRPK